MTSPKSFADRVAFENRPRYEVKLRYRNRRGGHTEFQVCLFAVDKNAAVAEAEEVLYKFKSKHDANLDRDALISSIYSRQVRTLRG
jgi:hypothetical protein